MDSQLDSPHTRCEAMNCEVVTIRSLREGRGVGRAPLGAVRDAANEAHCSRLWLITTNDNLRALELLVQLISPESVIPP